MKSSVNLGLEYSFRDTLWVRHSALLTTTSPEPDFKALTAEEASESRDVAY